jgi:NAD(P)-dependent dehydrogenase (short-subunit alcohol dehydrogenase family)
MKLANKVALITGASQGIGRGIALTFAREGADIIAVSRSINDAKDSEKHDSLTKEIEDLGRRVITIAADVRSREQVEAMFERGWSEMGAIDILVNNAGIETIVPFLEITDEQWNDITMVNLRGCWMCSQVFCRRAIAAKRPGNVVNIGSIQAAKVLPGRTHYAPTKLALEALTRNVSAEVAPLGIRVNCIHPGLIETPMVDWVLKNPDILPHVLAQISLARPGQPEEIGTVVAFIASDEASYVTGQSFHVDGGWEGK